MPSKKETPGLVHLVTQGTYDDYRVLCGAPTRKDANAIADKASGTSPWEVLRVESYPIYTGDLGPTWVYTSECVVSATGTISKKRSAAKQLWPWELQYVHPHGADRELAMWSWHKRDKFQGEGGNLTVSGLSREKVESVFERCIEDFSKSVRLRREPQLKGTLIRPTVTLSRKNAKKKERAAKKETAKSTAKKGG